MDGRVIIRLTRDWYMMQICGSHTTSDTGSKLVATSLAHTWQPLCCVVWLMGPAQEYLLEYYMECNEQRGLAHWRYATDLWIMSWESRAGRRIQVDEQGSLFSLSSLAECCSRLDSARLDSIGVVDGLGLQTVVLLSVSQLTDD